MSSIYYQHIRDYKRALAILEQRWDNKEKSYDYYDEKGNHSFFMRQYSETINNLLYYLQLKPDSILPKYDRLQKLTTIFSLAGFQDEAREFAYRQFELNNDSSQYTAWYPQIVFECGNFDEALKIYEKAYQQNKVGTTVYNKLLEIYLLSNNSQEGLKLLNEYVEYSDGIYTQIVPNYIIAYYHHLNGEQELAEQQFNEEIKRWEYFCSINEFQQSMQNYLTIAACYAMLGDKEGTIANLKKLNQKSSIPYLAVLRLKQSPMFNNFKNDKDFRAIKTKIEDKYLEEQKIIQTILKKHPVDFTFQQINNIHFYN